MISFTRRFILRHLRKLTLEDWLVLILVGIVAGLIYYTKKREKKGAVAAGTLAFYLGAVLEWTVIKRWTRVANRILPPFWSYRAIAQGNRTVLYEVMLNCGMLLPLGVLLPCMSRRMNLTRTMVTGVIVSCVYETLQYITGKGVAEVDDVFHNVIGVATGYCLYRAVVFIKRKRDCG